MTEPTREFIVIVPQIVGNETYHEISYSWDMVRKTTREAAIKHGLDVHGHDDWLIGILAGDELVGLAWMHEDRDDAEELEEAAAGLGLEAPRLPAESSPEPPTGPERGTGEAGPETTAQAATLRDASTSIHTIADHMPGRHPEFVRGVRYAATLLGHTADDLTEGATP